MDIDGRVAIDQACVRLSYEYARAIDFRDYDNFPLLFTDDAVLDLEGPIQGREAILEWIMTRPDELRSRHIMSNVMIDVLSQDTARGTAYLTLYRHLGEASLRREATAFEAPAAIGHYEDRYRRGPDGWLLQRRKLFLAFRNSNLLADRAP